MPPLLRKSGEVDADVIGGELVLMHLDTRKVVILNEAGHVVWDALDDLPTRADLLALLAEALPGREPGEVAAGLDAVLGALAEAGCVVPQGPPA